MVRVVSTLRCSRVAKYVATCANAGQVYKRELQDMEDNMEMSKRDGMEKRREYLYPMWRSSSHCSR